MGTIHPFIVLFLMFLLPCLTGCVTAEPLDHKRQELVYEDGKVQKFSYCGDVYGTNKGTVSNDFVEAVDMLTKVDPSVLPNLSDLPGMKPRQPKIQAYTGLIQNFTEYDISIPSGNSGATLVVPARGWLEYVNWERNVTTQRFCKWQASI